MVVQSQFIEMFGTPSSSIYPVKKLSEVCTFKSGTTFSPDKELSCGDYMYAKVADMNADGNETYITHTSKYVDGNVAKRTWLPKGTVVFPKRGAAIHTNKKRILIEDTCVDLNTIGVIPGSKIDSLYLYWFFRCLNLSDICEDSGIPQINNKNLVPVDFVVPPICVQLKFADVAKQADKSKFDGLKSQFISQFGNPITNPMGWSTKPLCQVAPESPSNIKMKGRVWVLNLDMIESNSGCIINKVFEDSDDLNSVAAFDEGNVLFSKLRPYLNKVTIPDEKGYATTELVPLRPHTDELRQYFLSFLLRTDEFVKYADGIATGTKMPRMPMTALREFKCILPPTELQDFFCGISKQADKSKYLS